MSQVKLEDDCCLSQGLDANSAGFEEIAEELGNLQRDTQ
jgi:hypothetical protein